MSLRPTFREDQVRIVESFLRRAFQDAGAEVAVIGLSGGLDSSVVATLCVRALGKDRVQGLWLRDAVSRERDRRDVESLVKGLGIALDRIDIAPMVQAFQEGLAITDRVVLGNVRARCRMIVAYTYSNARNGLVVGTGNKSEILTGYATKYGDAGVDLLPIGDLYKTQVREMARFLEVPKAIVEKPPSAGLWEGQTDEEELGLPYEDLDRILLGFELELDPEETAERTGLPRSAVDRVADLVRESIHKRKMPLIPKIGIRTVGLDWRE